MFGPCLDCGCVFVRVSTFRICGCVVRAYACGCTVLSFRVPGRSLQLRWLS